MSHILENKIVNNIYLTRDKLAIKFETTGGDIIARTDADCCSHTWVEHIELPALGFPAVVLSTENLYLADGVRYDEDTYTQFYGFKIVTDKGEIIIDYRNESNGYYGGDLIWPGEGGYYGGVYGQQEYEDDWELLESDV